MSEVIQVSENVIKVTEGNGCSTTLLTHHIVDGNAHNGTVSVDDLPGPGGAHHRYSLGTANTHGVPSDDFEIHFQKGPIGEVGVNGLTNEQILAVVIHRLECFQAGPYPSDYNQKALDWLRAGMDALHSRTRDRLARCVEGQNKS